MLTAMAALVTAAAQFMYGVISDRLQRTKPIFYVPILISAVAAIGLEWFHDSIWLVVLSVFFLSATGAAMGTLLDPWFTQLQLSGVPINYGLVRCCGSLFYALISAVFGTLLDRFGFTVSTTSFLGLLVLMTVSLLAIREPPRKVRIRTERIPIHRAVVQLLSNSAYLRFLGTVLLLFFGTNCINTFLPLRVAEMGGNHAVYGFCLLISAGSEIPFLLLSRRLRQRFSSFRLIWISMVMCLLKNLWIASSADTSWVLIAMIMQGPFFGVYLPAYLLYITEIVPQSLVYTATTLVSATLSLANVFASLYMGAVSVSLNLQQSMLTAMLPLVLAMVLFCAKRQKVKS